MGKITNKEVVNYYTNTHKHDTSDKVFPNLMLVRSFSFLSEDGRNKVLDYGCGYGANTVFMLSKNADVYYVDTSPYAVEKTNNKVKKTENNKTTGSYKFKVIKKDADALPYNDESFDIIVCASVMSLLSDKNSISELLNEFYRILRPGGRIYTDINGSDSEFAYYSKNIGNNQYEYRGRDGESDPIIAYCPSNIENFENFVGNNFKILYSGLSQHRLFEYREQEFIVIGEK